MTKSLEEKGDTDRDQSAGLADKYAAKDWMEQHSSNNELWYSSGGSALFHFLLVVVLGLILGMMAANLPQTQPPLPPIEVIVVDPTQDGDAQDDTDDNLGPALEDVKGGEVTDKPSPVLSDSPTVTDDVDTIVNVDKTAAEGDVGTESDAAKEGLATAGKIIAGARPRGAGEGNGGGGGRGKAGRGSRWILRLNVRDTAEYMRQLEQLGCVVAFPGRGGNFRYFPQPTLRPGPENTRSALRDTRICWIPLEKRTSKRVSSWMNLGSQDGMCYFMPTSLEDQLVEKELQKARMDRPDATEDDLSQTTFRVVNTSSGIDLICERVVFAN